jgi:hypothetical protein
MCVHYVLNRVSTDQSFRRFPWVRTREGQKTILNDNNAKDKPFAFIQIICGLDRDAIPLVKIFLIKKKTPSLHQIMKETLKVFDSRIYCSAYILLVCIHQIRLMLQFMMYIISLINKINKMWWENKCFLFN